MIKLMLKGGGKINLSIFLLKFPKDFPKERKERICERVYQQSFIELKVFTKENQREYAFEKSDMTEEEMRKRFNIPKEVEIINTSDWNHIPI